MSASALLLAVGAIFGDWGSYVSSDGSPAAMTINDSGQFFGEVCIPAENTCVWMISMDLRCNAGEDYTVLMNSEHGADSVDMRCDREIEGKWRYVFNDFDAVTAAVAKGGKIAFALALPDQQFRVMRFSLVGMGAAQTDMINESTRRQKKGTADLNL